MADYDERRSDLMARELSALKDGVTPVNAGRAALLRRVRTDPELRSIIDEFAREAELPSTGGARDPVWLSALRGRVLAAAAAAWVLWQAATSFVDHVRAINTGQITWDGVVVAINHADSTLSAASELWIAGAALIGLLAALTSKAREWWRLHVPKTVGNNGEDAVATPNRFFRMKAPAPSAAKRSNDAAGGSSGNLPHD